MQEVTSDRVLYKLKFLKEMGKIKVVISRQIIFFTSKTRWEAFK